MRGEKDHEAKSEYVIIVATTLIALKMLRGAHGDDSRVMDHPSSVASYTA